MTCIVALAKNDVVYVGADSCGSNNSSKMIVSNPKVFIVDNRFVIGVCDSFRSLDLLQYSLKVPKQISFNDDEFMRTIFISSVMETFKNNEFPRPDSDDSFNFIVGYRGKIYCVEEDSAIINPPEWGHSVGDGAEAARGSLWTTRDNLNPEERIMTALQASEVTTPSVCGPFILESLAHKRKTKKFG